MPIKKVLTQDEADYLRQQGVGVQAGDEVEFDDLPTEQSGAGEAGVHAFAASAAPSLAGGVGFWGGAKLGGALGLEGGPVGVGIGGLIGGLLGAYGASKATSKVQEALMPEELKAQLAREATEHPVATTVGGIAAMPLGGLQPFGRGLPLAAQGLTKYAGGVRMLPAERNALMQMGAGAGLGGIQEAVMAPLEGRDIEAKNIALNAALGATFVNPTPGLGKAFGFHPLAHTGIDDPSTVRNAMPQAEGQVVDTGGEGTIGTPPVQSFGFTPATKKTPESFTAFNPAQESANRMNQLWAEQAQRMAPALQGEVQGQLGREGLGTQLTPELGQLLSQELNARHGFMFSENPDLMNPATGQSVRGQAHKDVSKGGISYNPRTASVDTLPHEGQHYGWDKLSDKDRAQFTRLAEPELQRINQERVQAGKEPWDVEELFASEQGLEFIKQQANLQNETPWRRTLNEIQAAKARRNETATPSQFRRSVNYEFVNPAKPIVEGFRPAVARFQESEHKRQDYSQEDLAEYNRLVEQVKAAPTIQEKFQLQGALETLRNKYKGMGPKTGRPSTKQLAEKAIAEGRGEEFMQQQAEKKLYFTKPDIIEKGIKLGIPPATMKLPVDEIAGLYNMSKATLYRRLQGNKPFRETTESVAQPQAGESEAFREIRETEEQSYRSAEQIRDREHIPFSTAKHELIRKGDFSEEGNATIDRIVNDVANTLAQRNGLKKFPGSTDLAQVSKQVKDAIRGGGIDTISVKDAQLQKLPSSQVGQPDIVGTAFRRANMYLQRDLREHLDRQRNVSLDRPLGEESSETLGDRIAATEGDSIPSDALSETPPDMSEFGFEDSDIRLKNEEARRREVERVFAEEEQAAREEIEAEQRAKVEGKADEVIKHRQPKQVESIWRKKFKADRRHSWNKEKTTDIDSQQLLNKLNTAIEEKRRDLADLQKMGYREFVKKKVNASKLRMNEGRLDTQQFGFGRREDPLNRHYWYRSTKEELVKQINKDIAKMADMRFDLLGQSSSKNVNLEELAIKHGAFSQTDTTSKEFKDWFGFSTIRNGIKKGEEPLEVYRAGKNESGARDFSPFGEGFNYSSESPSSRGYYVKIENPASANDVLEVQKKTIGDGELKGENVEKVKDALIKEGYDGIVDMTAHPEIIPLKEDAARPTKKSRYQEDETGLQDKSQGELRSMMLNDFRDTIVNNRARQKKVSYNPDKFESEGERSGDSGIYFTGEGKGYTSQPHAGSTASHESYHDFITDNFRKLDYLMQDAGLNVSNLQTINKLFKQNGKYPEHVEAVENAIKSATDDGVGYAGIVPSEILTNNGVLHAIEEMFAQQVDGSWLRQSFRDFKKVEFLMEKIMGKEFTNEFNKAYYNITKNGIGEVQSIDNYGPAHSKYDPETKNYYQEDGLRTGFLRPLESSFNRVEKHSPKVAEAFRRWEVQRDIYRGAGTAALKDLSKYDTADINAVAAKHREAWRNGTEPKLTGEQAEISKILSDYYYDTIGKERRGLDVTINGRKAGLNKYYVPDQMSPKAINTLVNEPMSPEGMKIKKDWSKYIVEQSGGKVSKADADEYIKQYSHAIGGDTGNYLSVKYGAIRKAEGYGLPESIREKDATAALQRYSNRAAADLAMFKELESKPDIAAALGLNDPRTGGKVTKEGVEDLSSTKEVQNAMKWVTNSFTGGSFAKSAPKTSAVVRLVNNMLLGPATGIRDTASIPVNMLPYINKFSDLGAAMKGIAEIRNNSRKALRSGAVQPNLDRTQFNELLNAPDTTTAFLRKAAELARTFQGRETLENFNRNLTFSIGRELAKHNIIGAKSGNTKSKAWLEKFSTLVDDDITKLNGKKLDDALDIVAKNFTDRNQGTYGGRGLPTGIVDSQFAPFLALQKWSVEKSNTIFQDVIRPFMDGSNRIPLLTYTLGSVLTGAGIQELNKLLTGRKNQDPEWKEALKEGGAKDMVAELATLMQLGSFAGIVGDVVKAGVDTAAYGKTSKNLVSFPTATAASNMYEKLTDVNEALRQGENPWDTFKMFALDMMSDNIQGARMVLNHTVKDDQLERSDKFRDKRVFDMMQGKKATDYVRPNKYLNADAGEFKRTEDLGEAMEMLPDLISKRTRNGNYEEVRRKLEGLKGNSYQTMPSMESSPIEFQEFYDFLVRTQGKEEADARVEDFMRQRSVNSAKSAMVPSL